jgi:hypothetical protein
MTAKPTTGSDPDRKGKGIGPKPVKPSKRVPHASWLKEHGQEHRERLLQNIKARLPELERLLDGACECLRDPKDAHLVGNPSSGIHRRWRMLIREIFTAVQDLLPDRPITGPFRTMVAQATEGDYDLSATAIRARGRRVTEALTYAFYCLAAACRKGRELETPPGRSDGDWSRLLEMFRLR